MIKIATDLEVKSSHRFCFHSEEYMKLNGIKKWLLSDFDFHNGVEVSKVTSEICSKIKRLDNHLHHKRSVSTTFS